jgi:hypothetical protein
MHRFRATICSALGLSSVLLASPMIFIDTMEYNAGTIREGTKQELIHIFTVKNTGDSTLRITDARPG